MTTGTTNDNQSSPVLAITAAFIETERAESAARERKWEDHKGTAVVLAALEAAYDESKDPSYQPLVTALKRLGKAREILESIEEEDETDLDEAEYYALIQQEKDSFSELIKLFGSYGHEQPIPQEDVEQVEF